MTDIDAEIDKVIFGQTLRFCFSLPARTGPLMYSSDIDAAFLVVSKMREKGFHFLLMVSHDPGLAIASFYPGTKDRADLWSCTETHDKVALAICRAALRAVEVVV